MLSNKQDKKNVNNIFVSDIDTEYKQRTITQLDLNKKLEEQIEWYETELQNMKTRTKKGKIN